MSDAEIKLRGSRPYDTDEQILQRLKKGNKDSINRLKNKKDPPEELATGGIAGLRQGYDAGSKVIKYGKDIFNLLKNKKKLQKAFDNIFTTDDYKMDMEMVAESLVELNPKVFKNKLYDDLPDELRSEIYGAAMNVVNKDRALKLQLRKGAVDAKLVDEVVPEINRESMKLVDGKFETTKAPRKFKLNVDTFVRDFPVDRTEAERIATLSSKEQKVIIDKYLNNDMKQRVELMNFDPPKDRKPNAIGGRIGYYGGSSVDHAVRTMDPVQDSGHKIDKVLGAYKKYRRGEKNPRLSFSKFFELFSAETFATGGRAGYYGGGMTSMVGEDLSEIGHGSDSLMARNMQLAPNGQATTSTGLNYLLGQDNDTVRIPYGGGGTSGAEDRGYQGGGRDKKGSVSGTAPGAAAVGGGSEDRSSPEQNINHFRAMNNYQKPQESTIKNITDAAQEINYLKNIYNKNPAGLAISYGINKYGPSIMEKLKNLRSKADLEEKNMKMAELSETQLGYLNSKKTQRDLQEGFLSPQQIYDKLPSYEEKTPLNPFKGDQEPTTPQEFNKYLDTVDENKFLQRITVADGGIAGLREGYNEGNMVLPKPKPQDPMIELKRVYDLYAKASPGVSQETQKYLQQDFIQKLNEANISQEAFMTNRMQNNFAEGGRAAFSAGGFNAGRRGFLKIMGATAAGITAFKSGALKLLTAGKATSAIPKVISGTTGTPVWFENVVNKVLAEGVDVTTKLAIKDGQIVKSLDTPTGKVDVYYDNKTGALDLDYAGTNTSMGEAVNMRYTPGEAIETGVAKGTKTDEVFEATESIPEFRGNAWDKRDRDLDFGENVSNSKTLDDLYSDTSELSELGGEKLLIKDIAKTFKKKKELKLMNDNPEEFALENRYEPDYGDPGDYR